MSPPSRPPRPARAASPAAAPRPRTPPGAATLAARQARAAREQRKAGALPQRSRRKKMVVAAFAVAAVAIVAGAATLAWRRAPAAAPALPATPPAQAPVPLLGIAELLAGNSDNWRIARLAEAPAVMVVEFPSLAEQGAAMNRIATLLEKAGAPRDRVLSDAELAALIAAQGDTSQTFYLGHDYDAAGLARFFALARRQGQALTAAEERLRSELLAAGLLPAADGPGGGATAVAAAPVPATVPAASSATATPPPQALITFTATQPDDPATAVDEGVDARRRESVLRHEASHGRYYTEPAYRAYCRDFWRDVWSEPQREAMRRFLAGIGYNRGDEELMLNEAQAFLAHTADERAFNAGHLGMTPTELATLRSRFLQSMPAAAAASRR